MVLVRGFRGRWLQILVHIGAPIPLALLLLDYVQGSFLIDPIKEITTATGRTALVLLLLSLACTPINTVLGFRSVLRVRRALGLYAFLYAGVHFLTFVGLDYGFDLEFLGPALFDQRFVLVGFAAFLLLVALAVTSTKGWQKRLRRNWRRLHKLAYPAAGLVVLHFMWAVKDAREPLRYGITLVVLLAVRLPWARRAAIKARQKVRLQTHRLTEFKRSPL